MDKLWAPWRQAYVTGTKKKRCIFCGNRQARKGCSAQVVERSRHSFSMLNRYPYNNGHVMVAPYRHVKSLEYLSNAELLDFMKLVTKTKRLLDKRLKPHGYNMGINIGTIAGAGFAGHVHMHIVPRWTGDTNFMPVASDTKVISASLEAMHRMLTEKEMT